MASTDQTPVFLNTPSDWDAWNKQFKAEAKCKNLLDIVKGSNLPLTKSQRPNTDQFVPLGVTTCSAGPAATGPTIIADLTMKG